MYIVHKLHACICEMKNIRDIKNPTAVSLVQIFENNSLTCTTSKQACRPYKRSTAARNTPTCNAEICNYSFLVVIIYPMFASTHSHACKHVSCQLQGAIISMRAYIYIKCLTCNTPRASSPPTRPPPATLANHHHCRAVEP